MPRNGSGTFTLVSGNPVVTGTTIEANWANTTLSDIATTLTDSLSRSGQGGMTAALRVADGTQGAPGVGFANETGSGFYRAGTGEVWAVVQGAQTLNLDASGVYVPADKTTTVDGAFVFNEAGADKDARFEGDTDANLLFTDASTDRVGVGTNAPSTKMTVRGATQSQEVALRWERATDGAVAGGLGYFYDSENSVAVGSVTNHPLKLIVNDTTGATLTTTGLGIGTSSPGYKLDVQGASGVGIQLYETSTGNNNRLQITQNGTVATYNNTYSTGSGAHAWQIGNTEFMRLDSSGNLGLGVTPSAWGASQKSLEIGSLVGIVANPASNTLSAYAHNAYYNGTNWIYKNTSVSAARYEMTGANAGSTHAWYVSAGGTAGNAISFTQAMTLDASGNLLVGTTTTTNNLRLQQKLALVSTGNGSYAGMAITGYAGTDATARPVFDFNRSRGTTDGSMTVVANNDLLGSIVFRGADGSSFRDAAAISAFVNGTPGASDMPGGLIFETTPDGSATLQERARITSGGYFKASNGGTYVGSTSPYHELRKTENNADWAVFISHAGATAANQFGTRVDLAGDPNGLSNEFLYCSGGATLRASIRSNGGLANYSANDVNLSDRREKTNFAPAKSYLDTICAIPVQTFEYIDQSPDDPGLTLGVVAQDVQAVAPELVMESNWGTEDNPKMRLSIYQTDLQYALMKCIQELKAQNDELRARVAALEAQP